MDKRIKVIKGNITSLEVDAIVNAANKTLLGGGGVDGAIHAAAGPKLLEECKKLGGCEPGKAKITPGFNLKAKYVIHTVGPIWHGDNRTSWHDRPKSEAELLTSCYKECLKLAQSNNIKTIAFPAISTGAYGYPIKDAVRIAVREVDKYLSGDSTFSEVTFVCFGDVLYNEFMSHMK